MKATNSKGRFITLMATILAATANVFHNRDTTPAKHTHTTSGVGESYYWNPQAIYFPPHKKQKGYERSNRDRGRKHHRKCVF